SVGLQRFAEQPKYTEVNPGQDALLVCKVIDKRGVCSWQKDNKPVGIYLKKYEWASQYGIGQTTHIGGDCSLWVRAAQLEFDDGLWECQVTASDFTTQDALTSQPVRLVVRVPPQRPRLEHEGVHVPPGHNVTVDSGAMATVKCVSHYGNPPAQLKWFLGDQEITPLHPQMNSTEPDNPRTWSAASVVQIPANKDRHGAILKCLAIHESYAARSVAVEARLDVKYAPTVRLLGAPQIDLEEGKDSLILRCQADANPTASIVWRRAGRSEIASLQESLQLRPVGRRDAGLYTCQAQNSVGTSETLSVQLDVKYAPKILSAGPDRLTTAPLFSPAAFECVAEGNPQPTYKWVQRISTQSKPFLDRGRESRLVIDNVTYDYQGEYECRATNFINGQERTATSDPIALQVVGAPQVLRTSSTASGHSVSVRKGDSATLSLIVCADPRPRHVSWEWGSLRLEAGSGIGRFRVDDVTQDSREDCYLATLHIDDADLQDQRPYYLVVENDRGTDRHAVNLRVEGMFSVEPLELSYLLGIAGGCLAAFLILVCLCIYAIRTRKCCFRNRNNYKTSEKDSEKADLKSRSDSTSVPPLDSIYTTPTGFHHHHNGTPGSPEAMKVRMAAMILQPPTRVYNGSTSPKNASNTDRSVPGSDSTSPPSRGDQTEPIASASSYQSQTKSNDSNETNGGGIRLFKVSDYSVEKFNRFLDKLDKNNFLIKTNFKKSYSLILTRSHVAEQSFAVACTTKDSNNDSNNNCNDSVEGKKQKGNLIKANSSTGIYHQLGKSIEQPQEQLDSKRKPPVTHDLNSISDTGIQQYPTAESKQKEIERVNERQRPAEAGNNYKTKSLSLSYCNEGGKDNNNDSDEFCQSEIFDNDSTVPESQLDFVVNDLTGDAEKTADRIQVPARKMENNYENIRPCSSSTLSHCSRKHIRRKSNISYRNYHQEDNNGRMSLSKEEHEISSNNDARNKSAIPTRFFKRQDYAQPELDFPSDYSEPGGEGTTFSKRGPKVNADLFHLPFGTRKKQDKMPQLKNINLNFPNKTTHFDEQNQQPSNKVACQPHLVLHPVQWQKNENKYFSKAKTQILKLGQRCKLLGTTKEKRNHYISSYNLDDLIKATHKYEENEKSNLSNKIVYKSYKSELDLTKNLAYLDTFLNETFDNEPEQEAQKVRKPTRPRHVHKRAKSCSKTLDQMLMTASTTTAPLLMPQPNNARTQNLILLDDAWSEHKKVNSEQLKNNTVSSCSRASRTNKTKLASLIKMENDFSTTTVANEQNLFNDARPVMAGEKSGKSNTTSSSLSSSDYASVYSAPSPGAGGNNSSGNKIQNLKLIGTPEETLRCCGERGDFIEYSPKRPSKSRTEENDSNLDLLVLDDGSYYSLRANKSHQIHNNSSNCSIPIERSHNQDPEFYPHEFHNASTLQLPRLSQQNLYPDSSSSTHRQQRATRDPAQFRKQHNNPHHRRHHHNHTQQRQHPRRWHHRQSPLEADLTYQEDYLEHYQSTRAAAAAAAVGFKPVQSKGGSGASSGTIESNCDSSLEYFPNQSYHYGNTIIDNETLRNNISVNERGHVVDNADNDVDDEDDDSNSLDDNGVDDDDDDDNDEDADDGDDDGNPNGDNDGDSGGKIARDVIVSHDYNDRVAGRSRAHSFTNDFSQKDFLTSSRSFSRGTAVKLSQASGTVNPSFLSSYGPHRVIVSKSHKQRGELVLEYEC
ncbi:uncharacterized protein LOC135714094, partial [Ochlerotatus camptorhynchus]|uniref:uncharacterized protein LOC135714094 n=1 Tax=Ochlerotatus camptorhynchus TaxID=644619 RepID=UPI0031D73F81